MRGFFLFFFYFINTYIIRVTSFSFYLFFFYLFTRRRRYKGNEIYVRDPFRAFPRANVPRSVSPVETIPERETQQFPMERH